MNNFLQLFINKARNSNAFSILFEIYSIYIKPLFYINPTKTILSEIKSSNNSLKHNKCALVSHYDPNGMFDDVFLFYMKELRKLGFDLYIITTSSTLNKISLQKALIIVNVIIHRKNRGLDFASWASVIKKYKIFNNYTSVLLTNDSILGPLSNLESIINHFENNEGLGGITESREKGRHLQSYFLYLNSNMIRKKYIVNFFHRILALEKKEDIVWLYEIGLSQTVLQNADILNPFIKYEVISSNNIKNPTIELWEKLLLEHKFPFIKRMVFTKMITSNDKEKALLLIKDEIFRGKISQYISRYLEN